MLGPNSSRNRPVPTPETIPFGQWLHHYWKLQATCQNPDCNRISEVHMGEIINKIGEGAYFSEQIAEHISRKLVCIRCGWRGPKVTVVKG